MKNRRKWNCHAGIRLGITIAFTNFATHTLADGLDFGNSVLIFTAGFNYQHMLVQGCVYGLLAWTIYSLLGIFPYFTQPASDKKINSPNQNPNT